MTVCLTPELQRFVDEKVRAGEFSSADEAVNTLLSYIVQQEQLSGRDLDDLRAKVAVGIVEADRGELSDWDPDEVWAEVERRYAEQQSKKAG